MLTSDSATREFILAKPTLSDDSRRCNFLLSSYRVEAGDEEIVPLVQVVLRDNVMSMYIQCCDVTGPSAHAIDGTGVTTQVLCDELPCAVGVSNINTMADFLGDFLNSLAGGDYEVDEIAENRRGYEPGSRVDAIIDY